MKKTKNQIRNEALNAFRFRNGKEVLAAIQWEQMNENVGKALTSLINGRDALKKAYLAHCKSNSPKKKHPEMTFALDGRLVGDIGELIAATLFPLDLLGTKSPSVDAETTDGPTRKVQIKATFGTTSLSIKHGAHYFVGLQLGEKGRFRIVYNGPATPAIDYLKAPASKGKNGRSNAGKRLEPISLEAWAVLNLTIPHKDRIRRRNHKSQAI